MTAQTPTSGSPAPNQDLPGDEALVEELASSMRARWERGDRPLTEEFLEPHPRLLRDPRLALDLLYEEIGLRERFGLPVSRRSLIRRFPQWEAAIEILLDCHQLLEPLAPPTSFPDVGDTLGEFVLWAELGRGAAGRVFLAIQPALGDRPVVLKVTSWQEQEHLCLARLQHTHIVPLHAAGVDPGRRLRWLCMPYFGGAPLSRILELVAHVPPGRRTGRDLVAVLEGTRAEAGIVASGEGPGRALLARMGYVQAICHIGACLAEALGHAHSRNLVHLDVKPSNVLLAADGQPMLLDFHLAREPLPAASVVTGPLGGTFHYMPPEQRLAVDAVERGQVVPCAVDHRADTFALGVLLYQALGGRPPFVPGQSPRLDRVNPQVSVGLADLIDRSLSADPNRRHSRILDLAEDLRRHLRDQPLESVPNRSYRERWSKWRRRHPAGLRHKVMLAAVTLSTLAFLVVLGIDYHHRVDEADEALAQARVQWVERGLHDEALTTLQRGLDHLVHLPSHQDLAEQIRSEMQRVRTAREEVHRRRLTEQLHDLAEQMRNLSGLEITPGQRGSLDARCQAIWEQREAILSRFDPRSDARATGDFLDVQLLWLERFTGGSRVPGRPDAREVLVELERLLGPGAVLDEQRLRWGLAGQPRSREPRTVWEFTTLGRSLLRQGNLTDSRRWLERARQLEPGNRWTAHLLGECSYRQGRHAEAVRSFSLCIGADPANAVPYYNRGLALVALGHEEEALGDFTHALRLDSRFALAHLERGMLRITRKDLEGAERDLRAAREAGSPPATVQYHLARLALARGDRSGALEALAEALRHDPAHVLAKALQERLAKEERSGR